MPVVQVVTPISALAFNSLPYKEQALLVTEKHSRYYHSKRADMRNVKKEWEATA